MTGEYDRLPPWATTLPGKVSPNPNRCSRFLIGIHRLYDLRLPFGRHCHPGIIFHFDAYTSAFGKTTLSPFIIPPIWSPWEWVRYRYPISAGEIPKDCNPGNRRLPELPFPYQKDTDTIRIYQEGAHGRRNTALKRQTFHQFIVCIRENRSRHQMLTSIILNPSGLHSPVARSLRHCMLHRHYPYLHLHLFVSLSCCRNPPSAMLLTQQPGTSMSCFSSVQSFYP